MNWCPTHSMLNQGATCPKCEAVPGVASPAPVAPKPVPVLYVQTANGEFVAASGIDRAWRETAPEGHRRYNCDCLNADPVTGVPSDAADAIYCERWVYLAPASRVAPAPEELAEARETIKRLNRRCQLAEAAVNTKVEQFEQRSKPGLRSYYFQQGVDYRIELDKHNLPVPSYYELAVRTQTAEAELARLRLASSPAPEDP